jgi:hypothetical protein
MVVADGSGSLFRELSAVVARMYASRQCEISEITPAFLVSTLRSDHPVNSPFNSPRASII